MSDQSNNNRGITANSYTGNPASAEGAHPVQLDTKNARQAVPSPELHTDGMWDASSVVSGEKELLGQGTTGEGIKDDEYPSVPDPSFPGAGGTTNAGPQGSAVDFNSVAPYRNGEFPRDSYTAGAGKAAVPLT